MIALVLHHFLLGSILQAPIVTLLFLGFLLLPILIAESPTLVGCSFHLLVSPAPELLVLVVEPGPPSTVSTPEADWSSEIDVVPRKSPETKARKVPNQKTAYLR